MKKTYEEIVKIFKDQKCELCITKDEYSLIANPSRYRFYFKSSCGHDNTVTLTNFISKSSGLKCKNCVKSDIISKLIDYNKANDAPSSKGHAQENQVFNIITELLQPNINIIKTHEGCKADFAIKPCDEINDKWLGVQLKTTRGVSHNLYGFKIHKNDYDNMVLLCYCVSDNSIWLIPFQAISHVKRTINIGLTEKSIYSKYKVDKHTIINKLQEYYKAFTLNKIEHFMIPANFGQQTELKYRKIREEYCNFLKFDYPEIEQCYYDFKVNGKNVQEKVLSKRHDRIDGFVGSICRGRTHEKRKHYEAGMNEYYWFHVPDLNLFFLIPEFELCNRNYINNGETAELIGNFVISLKINYKKSWYYKYQYDYNAIDTLFISKLFE